MAACISGAETTRVRKLLYSSTERMWLPAATCQLSRLWNCASWSLGVPTSKLQVSKVPKKKSFQGRDTKQTPEIDAASFHSFIVHSYCATMACRWCRVRLKKDFANIIKGIGVANNNNNNNIQRIWVVWTYWSVSCLFANLSAQANAPLWIQQ